MRLRKQSTGGEKGFTIVELIVVIAIIAILATISILGYGAWRSNTIATQVQSDLNAVSTAMESYRSFNNGYPTSIPSTVQPSGNDTLTLSPDSTTTNYCVDGVSSDSPSSTYYVASETKDQGALAGTCATRPGQTLPGVPSAPMATTVASTTVSLTWSAASGPLPTSYTAQCASDLAFVENMGQVVMTTPTGTVTGLAANATHYCRVKATNGAGDSAWSPVTTATTNPYQPPTGLAFSATTNTSITLSWTANSDAYTYTLQCATNSGFTTGVISQSVTSPATTWTFSGLGINVTYYCKINTVNPNGTSAWSSATSGRTVNVFGSLAVGSSIEGYWTTAPQGYLIEDGSAVSRNTYSDLFAVIGTTYGAGDGSTTFNLPDSRAYTVVNRLSTDANFATVGQKTGAKTVTIATAQLPSHSHNFTYGGSNYASFPYTGAPNTSGGLAFSVGTTLYGGVGLASTGGGGASNTVQPSIVKMRAIKYAPIDNSVSTLSAGSSINGYWTSAPTGYLLEDGSAVSRSTYSNLFSSIGTTYGAGDGSTTFNLPDSRGRASVNLNPSDAEFSAMGEKYGEEAHTMSILEMPSHTHNFNYSGNISSAYSYTGSPNTAGGIAFSVGLTVYGAVGIATAGSGTPFNDIQSSITQTAAIKYTPATTGSDVAVAVGTSTAGYWSSVPSGFLAENGSAVSRSTYANLFAVIGTTYGTGDGSTTFNLPDSRGRVGVGLSPSDVEFNTIGEKYGEKTHTLTIAEMPSHSHNFTYGGGSYASWQYTGSPNTAGNIAFSVGTVLYGSIGVSSTGGGQPFNNIQPSIVKTFVIKY
ncbi:MAG: hypothetical protein JWN26_401 [Candidatus Saccharibacteria bacterium]|nr:hypothetical protein [Candidatus Saccharibacteria bacterium]